MEFEIVEREILGRRVRASLRRNANAEVGPVVEALHARAPQIKPNLPLIPADYEQFRAAEKLQWASSRRCLLDVVDETPLNVSLSHTRLASVAVSCRDGGVGVDLEPRARGISDGVFRRIVTPAERVHGLKPIELWCLKEACFKADPQNKGSVLAHYVLVSYDAENREARLVKRGADQFCGRLFEWQEFVYAVVVHINARSPAC